MSAGGTKKARKQKVKAQRTKGMGVTLRTTHLKQRADGCTARDKTARGNRLHLLSLPQDVQERIYGYAVFEPETIDMTAEKWQGSSLWRMAPGTARPALAATGKHLRGMVLSPYFNVNTFRLICNNTAPKDGYERVCAMDPA
ncbi:hypothetical protein DOTSEDRAFT_28555 [Dothistroma septosporum NZE10]|uniref:F-box domain-containing protein n=1 Tax=Dothistroma septosporum (strain NZE10 / CBS 128990) TaxID=675120 RepID=M2XIW9_DOTSN|nr:hypothetical protein DOTSEDRAFT_28555 [Dothistroma septosporum NZE10]